MNSTIFLNVFTRRTIISAGFIGLFFFLSSIAYRYGLADIKHYQVMSNIEKWHKNSDMDQWRKTRLILHQINELHPDNPYYLELLAQTEEMSGRQSKGKVAEVFYREALNSLERSIRLRPISPYTWLNMAKIKVKLGEFDEQFVIAVESALKFGRWIESIQQGVAVIGFRYWEELPKAIKLPMKDNLNRAVRIQQTELFNLAEKHGATEQLCLFVRGNVHQCNRN